VHGFLIVLCQWLFCSPAPSRWIYGAAFGWREERGGGQRQPKSDPPSENSFVSTKTISVLNVKYKYIIRKKPEMIQDMSDMEIIFAYGAKLNEK